MMDGVDTAHRILQLTQSTLTVADVKHITRVFLAHTFNHFEFPSDLRLPSMHRVGDGYSGALAAVTNKEEFIELAGALLIYLTRMYRWIHLVFPWHLGTHFPRRAPADIVVLPKLLTYSSSVENA